MFTPSLIELTYVDTRWSQTDIALHDHENWELVYHREGRVQTIQGSDLFEMRPGMAIIHPPRVSHRDIRSEDWSVYFLQFKVKGKFLWPRLVRDDDEQSIGRVCGAILREYHGYEYGKEQLLKALTDELDVLLQRSKAREALPESARIVTAAKGFLDGGYNNSVSIAELAAKFGVSQSWLYLHFTKLTGVSPKQYLQSVRVAHAVALLRETNHTLDWIASTCGFSTISQLSRQIKAATGVSPGGLRTADEKPG